MGPASRLDFFVQARPSATMRSMKLRFSIRDLFWLTLVVVMAMGWFFDRHALVHERDHSERMLRIVESDITYLAEAIKADQGKKANDQPPTDSK
jgi:hypothetical protein